jgi:hypothetical protein
MTKQTNPTVTDPDAREKLHIARVLLGGYAALSVLTLMAIVVFSGDPDIVTAAPITFALGVSMAKGSRNNYRRVQIIAMAQVVAIVVIEPVPDAFPLWCQSAAA